MSDTATSSTLAAPVPLAARYGRGVLFALLATLAWSLSGVFVRLIETAGSWQIVLYRSLATAVTLAAVLAFRYRGRIDRPLRAAGINALLAAAAMSGSSTLFILSVAHVTVANALFMNGVTPFITALIARAWLGEPVAWRTWAGIALAAAGVLVMVRESLAFEGLLGNLLAFGSALCFAFLSIFLRRGRQVDMTPTVLWSGLFSTMLATLVLAAQGGPAALVAIGPRDLALCAVMGSVQLGLGSIFYAVAARHLPAAGLQLLAMAELVFSPLWVWLAVSEVPGAATLAGGAMILTATLIQASAALLPAGGPALRPALSTARQ